MRAILPQVQGVKFATKSPKPLWGIDQPSLSNKTGTSGRRATRLGGPTTNFSGQAQQSGKFGQADRGRTVTKEGGA